MRYERKPLEVKHEIETEDHEKKTPYRHRDRTNSETYPKKPILNKRKKKKGQEARQDPAALFDNFSAPQSMFDRECKENEEHGQTFLVMICGLQTDMQDRCHPCQSITLQRLLLLLTLSLSLLSKQCVFWLKFAADFDLPVHKKNGSLISISIAKQETPAFGQRLELGGQT